MLVLAHVALAVAAPHAPAALAPSDRVLFPIGWSLDLRVYEEPGQFTGCPDGQRNADESECLAAVQEATQALALTLASNDLDMVDAGADGWVPSGCSYSRGHSQRAMFNRNPAGRNWGSYPLVCIEDEARAPVADERQDPAGSTLVAREFSDWAAYYEWRWGGDDGVRKPVVPCVRSSPQSFDCLPSLITIGAFKGGTTGLRYKLLASQQWVTRGENEGDFWGEFPSTIGQTADSDCNVANTSTLYQPACQSKLARIAHDYAGKFGKITTSAERLEFRDLLADEDNHPRKLAFDDSPIYLDDVGLPTAQLIRSVVPDAQILLLVRSAGDVAVSGTEMMLCENPPYSSEHCSPLEVLGCSGAQAAFVQMAQTTLAQGRRRREQLEHDSSNPVDALKNGPSHRLGAFLSKGAYAWPLQHVWLEAFPTAQVLAMPSERLWFNESEAFNELTTAALLPFRTRLVNGTRTRPVRQDEARCKCKNTSAFRSFADDCNLNRVYNCVFTRANSDLATLLNASWPLDLNSIDNVLTFDQCKDVGFSDADLLPV